GLLLAISFALQMATLAMYHHLWMPVDLDRVWAGEASLPAYQFWLVAGGVAAMRLERFDALVRRHARLIVALVVVAAVVAEAAYVRRLAAPAAARTAVAFVATIAAATALAALANRTPLSLPLIGRNRYRGQVMPPVATTSRPGPRSVTLGL